MFKTNSFTIASLEEAKAILTKERENALYLVDLLEDKAVAYQKEERQNGLSDEQYADWKVTLDNLLEAEERFNAIEKGFLQLGEAINGLQELEITLSELATDGRRVLIEY